MNQKMPGILSRRLFHRALKKILNSLRKNSSRRAVDADGYLRDTLRRLMAYIADMEEVWTIMGIGFYCCPFCEARKNDLDSAAIFPMRSSQSILDRLVEVRASMREREGVAWGSADDTYAFATAASKEGLGPIEELFYEWMVSAFGFDIREVITHDPLHWDHKCLADHVLTWNQNILNSHDESLGEDAELDLRMRLQLPRPGFRHFSKGISKISQWTQGDTRDLEKEFIGATAGAPGMSKKLMDANRTYLDYIYIAGYPYHTDKTLKTLDDLAREFEAKRQVYIDLGGRKGEASGDVIENFLIPKLHIPRHVPDNIRLKGGVDGLSTEAPERLHIVYTKDAFRATNHRDHEPQMIRWLDLQERMVAFGRFLAFREGIVAGGDGDGGDGERKGEEEDGVVRTKIARRTWQVPNPEDDNVDYCLTKRPHHPASTLRSVMKKWRLPDLFSDLQDYLKAEGLQGVPLEFNKVDVWTHVRLLLPIPNDWMKTEWRRVRANPDMYDAVLFNEDNANVVGLEGACSSPPSKLRRDSYSHHRYLFLRLPCRRASVALPTHESRP